MDGILVVDKPEGWTSHDVVNKVRRIAGTRRVGHLGTLDPIATGVLPVMIEQATRLAQFYTHAQKEYEAAVRFGFATDSYDRTGTPTSPATEPLLNRDSVERALESFRGATLQTPPAFSAKKVDGVPAYQLARKQVAVALEPVEVTISELELLEVTGSRIEIRVLCSAGTYVRTLAHDLGRMLGWGAHLESLRRTASGDFTIAQARTIPVLEQLKREDRLQEAVLPAADLLPQYPAVFVEAIGAGRIRQGRDFQVSPFRPMQGTKYVKALTESGQLLAIGEARLPNVYHPIVVFT